VSEYQQYQDASAEEEGEYEEDAPEAYNWCTLSMCRCWSILSNSEGRPFFCIGNHKDFLLWHVKHNLQVNCYSAFIYIILLPFLCEMACVPFDSLLKMQGWSPDNTQWC
jgi:hypothetical protein